MSFEIAFKQWMEAQIETETNPRRRERLSNGISYSETEFLRRNWYPAVGHFEHLYAQWEVRDFAGRLRYIDFGYLPGFRKGAVEIHDFRSHARDLDIGRFKDLCARQAVLALDDWIFLPIAYPAVVEDPKFCQQLILSFVGKFLAADVDSKLSWLEAEAVRFANRLLRPFTPQELHAHLRVSPRHVYSILHRLVASNFLLVASGDRRYRTYMLNPNAVESIS